MPRQKMVDGKPVLDAEGKPVMEATPEEQLAEVNTRLAAIEAENKAKDAELKRTQALNRQLLSSRGNGGGMNVNDTIRQGADGPDFSGLDFVGDPNGAVKTIVGAVVENVRQVLHGSESAKQKAEELKRQFYDQNPDLKGYEDLVAIQANKIQSEGTYNDDTAGGFAECAKRTRQWLKDKGLKVVDGQQQPPAVLPGSGANDQKPPIKKEEAPFDEAKEQADALAEEIKMRGETTGRRTTRTA